MTSLQRCANPRRSPPGRDVQSWPRCAGHCECARCRLEAIARARPMRMRSVAPAMHAEWLPPAALPVAVLVLLFLGPGPNFLLALLSVFVLLAGCAMLWRPGEAPVFLFIFAYQWLQASARIFHANVKGVDVAAIAYADGQVTLATILSLIVLLALSLGFRLGMGPWQPQDARGCLLAGRDASVPLYFRLYAYAWLGATAAHSLAYFAPGLRQPLIAAAGLKWHSSGCLPTLRSSIRAEPELSAGGFRLRIRQRRRWLFRRFPDGLLRCHRGHGCGRNPDDGRAHRCRFCPLCSAAVSRCHLERP